jgi:hypothetical protein
MKNKWAEGGKSKGERVQKDLRAWGEDFRQGEGTVPGVAMSSADEGKI